MGLNHGAKIVNNGLVLCLDAANIKSFRGEPTTNLLTMISWSQGTQTGTYFKSNYGYEIVNIPTLGQMKVHYCNIYNDYNGGSGACCPTLFDYGSFLVSPSTTYTYQILYKTENGYYSTNYMYRYEYNGGTYVGEAGFLAPSRMENLGNGWIHGWGTFTTSPTTTALNGCAMFHYEYATYNKVYLAGIMLTQRSTPLSYKHFLSVGTTRGSTVATDGGWKDLSGNAYHGELTTGITYNNSNSGSLILNGSNNYISLGSDITIKTSGGWTVDSWIKYNFVPADYDNVSSPGNFIGSDSISYNSWYWSTYSNKLALWNLSPGVWKFGSTTLQTGNWYNAVLVCYDDGTKYQMYLNGVPESGDHTTYSWNASYSGLKIKYFGKGDNNNVRFFNGYMSNNKVYNRALSATEVLQNFNATKNRYFTIGVSSETPAISATQLSLAGVSTNGVYWLCPTTTLTPYQAYIDFTTANGPWVHVGTAVGNTRGLYTYRDTWSNRSTNSGTATNPYENTTSSFNAGSFINCKGDKIMIKYDQSGYVQASGFNNESWRDVYLFLNNLTSWPSQPSYNRELTITERNGVVTGPTVSGAGLLYGTNTANGVYTNYYVYAFDSGGDTMAYLSTGTYSATGIYSEADHGIGANENGPNASSFPGDDSALAVGLAFDAGTNDATDSGGAASYNNIPFSLWIKN